MGKRKSGRHSLPPATMLRPRLDALLGDPQTDPDTLLAQASALADNVSSELFLATLLRSFAAAPLELQTLLAPRLPAWLRNAGRYDAVQKIAVEQREEPAVIETARRWLQADGVDIGALAPVQRGAIFDSAFCYGNEIQSSYHAFWHVDHHRDRMHHFAYLTDMDLTWQGAAKDAYLEIVRSPDALRNEMEGQSLAHGLGESQVTDVSGAAFKRALLTALEANRREHIRLPSGLAPLRDFFASNILALPDQPDTPRFSVNDFDALAQTGQNVESLRLNERRFGKRVALPDGEEVRVLNPDMTDMGALLE
jgi:hypothetical protein